MFSTNFISMVGSGEPAFDLDAQAFFDRVTAAGGTLSPTEKEATNQLVEDFKGFGIWTLMKAIYPLVGGGSGTTAARAAACSQNLKSSSYTGDFSAGWTFASTGILGNGITTYMDTGVIPNDDLLLNSAHVGAYVRGSNAGNHLPIGGRGADASNLIYISNYGYMGVNNGDVITVSTQNETGLFINTRTSVNGLFQYKNDFELASFVVASTGLGLGVIWLGAFNDNNSILGSMDNELAFGTIGDGLSPTQVANYYTAVQAFQTTLSRQV